MSSLNYLKIVLFNLLHIYVTIYKQLHGVFHYTQLVFSKHVQYFQYLLYILKDET